MTIGVDVGGTKVAAALVTASGEISHKTRVPMVSAGDAATAFAAVRAAIDGIFDAVPEARGAVTGIGICSPGPLDPFAGVVLNPPNLPCWPKPSGAPAWDTATSSLRSWARESAPASCSTGGSTTDAPAARPKVAT